MANKLKKEFIKLLKEDEEFRYTVAGLIGLGDILREIKALREDFNKMLSRMEGMETRMDSMENRMEGMETRMDSMENRMEGMETRMDSMENRMGRMETKIDNIGNRLGRVERTLEKLTIDIEEEARIYVRHFLKRRGIEIDIGALVLDDLEINLYGYDDGLTIVGEVSVRCGIKLIYEVLKKVEIVKEKYSEKLKGRVIPTVYCLLPTPEVIEEAKRNGVWLLKSTKEFVSLEDILKE
ncbi:MAG: hypothetical protein ACP6IP_03245 [Candidatus Njordarchaeia archaeon]